MNLTLEQAKFIKVLDDSFKALSKFDPGLEEFYSEAYKNTEIKNLLQYIDAKITTAEAVETVSNYIKLGSASVEK